MLLLGLPALLLLDFRPLSRLLPLLLRLLGMLSLLLPLFGLGALKFLLVLLRLRVLQF